MTHQRFNRFIRPYLQKEGKDTLEVFAVMREPVSWLGSWYRYRQRPDLRGTPNSTEGISFDDFVTAYLSDGTRPSFARLGSQARQLSKSRDAVGIDHLFRYERLGSLVDFLFDRLGVRLSLRQINVSPQISLSLSPKVAARLRCKHALDFDTYASISL